MEKRFHRGIGRGLVRPHGQIRHIGGRMVPVPGAAGHRRVHTNGMSGHPAGHAVHGGTRMGQIVGGRCVCAPCPACGGFVAGSAAAPAPAYCRCCGQVLR
jgi:hypothetical protein